MEMVAEGPAAGAIAVSGETQATASLDNHRHRGVRLESGIIAVLSSVGSSAQGLDEAIASPRHALLSRDVALLHS